MSYKNLLNISISLDKSEFFVHEEITGTIIIRNDSPVDIELENIKTSLILKHYGKGETSKNLLSSLTNNEFNKILKGESKNVLFNLPPAYNVTFNSKNISQSIGIETIVSITKESAKLCRDDKLSNLKLLGYIHGLFSPEFHKDKPITIVRGDAKIQLRNAKGTIEPGMQKAKALLTIGTIAAIAISLLVFFNSNRSEIWFSLLILYSIFFLIVYILKIKPSQDIGPIHFRLKNLEDDFYHIDLKMDKRLTSTKEIGFQLIGEEKVTYDNGSNRSTIKYIFFENPIVVQKIQRNSTAIRALLPSESLPISIQNGDFEISWYFKISTITKRNLYISGKHIIDLAYHQISTN